MYIIALVDPPASLVHIESPADSPMTDPSVESLVDTLVDPPVDSPVDSPVDPPVDSPVDPLVDPLPVDRMVDEEALVATINSSLHRLGYGCTLHASASGSLVTGSSTAMVVVGNVPKITGSRKQWLLNYTIISFMMNGQLYAEYCRLSHMLDLPSCSDSHWQRVVVWLGEHVSELAEWSCQLVREIVKKRGDKERWKTTFDGFYLTRGFHSNNSSATLHDYESGGIAWYTHRTKRGAGHNWKGTSGGSEGDMFNELMEKVKLAGFNIAEVVVDKDTSINAIFCRHFPDGIITYCSNHSAKTLHKDLQKIKQLKCDVREYMCNVVKSIYVL